MTTPASPPDRFKQTEIGLIPEEWDVSTLGGLFEMQQGKALSARNQTGKSPQPFLRTANVFWGRLDLSHVDSMDFTEQEAGRLSLRTGDLLVCEGGDIGRTAMWQGEIEGCSYQNHIHRLRTKDTNTEPIFYMYWMQAATLLLRLYGGEGNKTTIPNLSKARLSTFQVPLPPLPEQRAIARILSTLQSAAEAQAAIAERARELKRALMAKLFAEGLRGKPLKETEIGPMPEGWKIKPFGEVATLQRGNDLPVQERIDGPFPIVGSNGVVGYHSQYVVDGPGVATGRSGTIGKATYVEEKYWPLNTSLYVKDFHGNNPLFVYYFFETFDFKKYRAGVTVPTLNRNLVHTALIASPPLDEQREIARILQTVDAKIAAAERKRAGLEELFRAMLVQLMTGRVRVAGQRMGSG